MLSLVTDYPVSAVMFLVAFFCIFQSWILKKDFFSPINVYCFSQCVTLGVAYLKLDYAMSDFRLKTWFFWIGAMICFCTGGFLVRLVAKSKNLSVSLNRPVHQYGYNWKMHVFLCFCLVLFYLVGVLGIIRTAGKLLILLPDPASYMTKNTDYGYYPIFYGTGPLCVMLFGLASFAQFNPVKSLRIVSRVMVVLLVVLNFMAYPNRGTLFFCVGFLVILTNYLYKKIKPMWILVGIALAIATFVGISTLRHQYGMASFHNTSAKKLMMLPYIYVANNYWNFDYAINPPSDREYHPHTYGIDFFAGVMEYTGTVGTIRRSHRWDGLFNDRIQKTNNYNTANYLWEVYKDLYTPGVLLFPLICGMIMTLLHLRLCRPFSPRALAFYTVLIYYVGWWFFTPGYKQGQFWLWLAMIYFITTVCKKYNPLPPNAPVLDKVCSEEDGEEQIPAQCEKGNGVGSAGLGPDGADANV